MEDCILVSFVAPTNGDVPVLIAGRQKKQGDVDILNAFQGKEATDLYVALTTMKNPLASPMDIRAAVLSGLEKNSQT